MSFFVYVFVIVFVFVFVFLCHFWIAIIISIQKMYGFEGVCQSEMQVSISDLRKGVKKNEFIWDFVQNIGPHPPTAHVWDKVVKKEGDDVSGSDVVVDGKGSSIQDTPAILLS